MASSIKEFDPNRKYKLVLSERLLNSTGNGEYTYASIQGIRKTEVLSSGAYN